MSVPRRFKTRMVALVDTADGPVLHATNEDAHVILLELQGNMVDLLESEIVKLRKSKSVNAS